MVTYGLISPDNLQKIFPERNGHMSGSVVRATLEAQRRRALDDLVEEPDRGKRASLRTMVLALEAAMASLPSDQSQTEYGRFKRVRDAIAAYLAAVNRPVPAEQIVDAMIEGGMRRQPLDNSNPSEQETVENTRTIIRKSIAFHLIHKRGIDVHLIKERRGKIGLWEWPDERFQ